MRRIYTREINWNCLEKPSHRRSLRYTDALRQRFWSAETSGSAEILLLSRLCLGLSRTDLTWDLARRASSNPARTLAWPMAPVASPPAAANDMTRPAAAERGGRTSIAAIAEIAENAVARLRELREAERQQEQEQQEQEQQEQEQPEQEQQEQVVQVQQQREQEQRSQEQEQQQGRDTQHRDADDRQIPQHGDAAYEDEESLQPQRQQGNHNKEDLRREPSTTCTDAADTPSSASPVPVPPESMRQLARIHLLERQLQESRLRAGEVAALREKLHEREAEVYAFARIIEGVRTALEDGDKAAKEAAIYKSIVADLRRRSNSEPVEPDRLHRAHSELQMEFKNMEIALKEEVRVQKSEVTSLRYVLERQRQYSSEVQRALESKCDLLKSTNRLLS
jgi:hypothetical protein